MRLSDLNARLRHETTSGTTLDGMDTVRGLACLGVVFLHCLGDTGRPYFYLGIGSFSKALIWPARQGWAGLDLFFFISGFLLFMSFGRAAAEGRRPPSVIRFYRRRFLRLGPAYTANIAIVLLLWGLVFSGYTWYRFDIRDVAAHLLFVHNLIPEYSQSLNPVLWTLAIEAQFYLVLPVVARWFHGRRWFAAGLIIVVAAAAYRYGCIRLYESYATEIYINSAVPPYNQLAWRFDQFAVGICFAAYWLRSGDKITAVRADVFGIAGLSLIVAALMLTEVYRRFFFEKWVVLPPVLTVGFGLFVLGLLRGTVFRKVFVRPSLEFVGIISYSVYLWHYILIMGAELAFPALRRPGLDMFFLRAGIFIVPSLAVGLVSYLLFERPFLKARSA